MIEDSFAHLTAVKDSLNEISKIDRNVASDLGLEGATAHAACRTFDRIATHLASHAQKIQQLIKVTKDALNGGKQAQNDSAKIQSDLAQINNLTGKALAYGQTSVTSGNTQIAAQIQAQQDAAHAQIDQRAKDALTTLNSRTLTAISGLPFQPVVREHLAQHHPEIMERLNQHEAARTTPPDNPDRRQSSSPARSATAWSATPADGPTDHSSAGHWSGGSGATSGMLLQNSHYTPSSSGSAPALGNAAGGVSRASAVYNPLTTAAALAGAAGVSVAGARAYQAARTAATARPSGTSMRSGAAIRSAPATTPKIMRSGAVTAPRTATQALPKGTLRGGASGIARPTTPASSRGSGILRGTTTAARKPATPTSSRGSGILRGATTAARKTTTSPSSAGTRGTSTSSQSARTSQTGTRGTSPSSRSSSPSQTNTRGTRPTRTTSSWGAATSRNTAAGQNTSRGTGTGQGRSTSSSGRALSSLTGRTQKTRKKQDDDNRRIERIPVSPYEDDKTITFLEAGHTTKNNNDR